MISAEPATLLKGIWQLLWPSDAFELQTPQKVVKPCFPLILSCWLLLSVRAQRARSLSRFWEVTASVQASTGETAVGFMTEGPCSCCRDSSLYYYYCKLHWSVTHLKVLTLSLRCSPKINTCTHKHLESEMLMSSCLNKQERSWETQTMNPLSWNCQILRWGQMSPQAACVSLSLCPVLSCPEPSSSRNCWHTSATWFHPPKRWIWSQYRFGFCTVGL